MADYRPQLQLSTISGTDINGAVKRFGLVLAYLLSTTRLVVGASRRAKSTMARCQLMLGVGGLVLLLLSTVFTALAVLAALDIWQGPVVSGNAADAIELGATAFTTWLFSSIRPAVQNSAVAVEQLLEYVHDERHAASVAGTLESALDDLIEADPTRNIHILSYSFGALVAMDFLYPHRALHVIADNRYVKTVKTLTTIGLPVDFIRLYLPRYTDDREARIPDLRWMNIYIAADVFGSNLINGDDFTEGPNTYGSTVPRDGTLIAGRRPVSLRYTNERLTSQNISSPRRFLSHVGYWDAPEQENCLHLVMREVLQ